MLAGHAGQVDPLGAGWPFDETLQHSTVVIFLVLSGLLIQQSASRPGMTLAAFARARLARIAPVVLFSLILSTGLFVLGERAGFWMPDGGHYHSVSVRAVVLPLLFLSERPGGVGPALDPPFWSMCYEAWFYALLALCMFLRGTERLLATALAAMLAGVPALLLLPAWLWGVAVGLRGTGIDLRHPWAAVAIGAAGFAASRWSGLPAAVVEEAAG